MLDKIEGFSLGSYLLLVDYTGRLFREGKATISRGVAEVFVRLGTSAETRWSVVRGPLSSVRCVLSGRGLTVTAAVSPDHHAERDGYNDGRDKKCMSSYFPRSSVGAFGASTEADILVLGNRRGELQAENGGMSTCKPTNRTDRTAFSQ